MTVFRDRVDAGVRLARRLTALRDQDVVVLGLPRGGVPVAFEVAAALDTPLDVIVVAKLGVPFEPELAMGAIGEGGARVLNTAVTGPARISADAVAAVEQVERTNSRRRWPDTGGVGTGSTLDGRVAVVVDDGVATGSTGRAACAVARELGAARVVLASATT